MKCALSPAPSDRERGRSEEVLRGVDPDQPGVE